MVRKTDLVATDGQSGSKAGDDYWKIPGWVGRRLTQVVKRQRDVTRFPITIIYRELNTVLPGGRPRHFWDHWGENDNVLFTEPYMREGEAQEIAKHVAGEMKCNWRIVPSHWYPPRTVRVEFFRPALSGDRFLPRRNMDCLTTLREVSSRDDIDIDALADCFGKTELDDEPLALSTILDVCGYATAVSCMCSVPDIQMERMAFAFWCAKQLEWMNTSQKSLEALDTVERYLFGDATDDELVEANQEARDANTDAVNDEDLFAATRVVYIATSVLRNADYVADLVGVAADTFSYALFEVKKANVVEAVRLAIQTLEIDKFREMFCTPTAEEPK